MSTAPKRDLPLLSRTPVEWGRAVLADPIPLLVDHAFLEKKAATNAMELLTRWPNDWLDGWVEAMISVARDETAHLAQVTRILLRRGGRLDRFHKNPYANALRQLVRKGEPVELLDRLLVAALIELRSCERFSVLAEASPDPELADFYGSLFSSERGHYTLFLTLAGKFTPGATVDKRWREMLAAEATIMGRQEPGPRIHSGVPDFHGTSAGGPFLKAEPACELRVPRGSSAVEEGDGGVRLLAGRHRPEPRG